MQMVAAGTISVHSKDHRDFRTMSLAGANLPKDSRPRGNQYHGIRDITVKGDAVVDIVERFIKVAHGPEALEDNRARENARENIRKKLALEAGKEKSDSCDLQICFMNEFASDEDISEDADPVSKAAEEIAKSNISHRKSQIIVPLSPSVDPKPLTQSSSNSLHDDATVKFQEEVRRLQKSAQASLVRARENVKGNIQDTVNLRQQRNRKLFELVGLPKISKVNRGAISRLNVAQLQLIQNDYLAQIESLNEELVCLLVSRDELVMEQDAMLTDIQDLAEFTSVDQ